MMSMIKIFYVFIATERQLKTNKNAVGLKMTSLPIFPLFSDKFFSTVFLSNIKIEIRIFISHWKKSNISKYIIGEMEIGKVYNTFWCRSTISKLSMDL